MIQQAAKETQRIAWKVCSTLTLLSLVIQEHPAENQAFYDVPKLYVQQGYNMHLLIGHL